MTLCDDFEIELGGFYGPSEKKVSIGVLRRSARKVVLPSFPDLLEPAIQEAAIRLHTHPAPEAVDNPKAYGATVARNTAKNLRSKELRQRDIASALTRENVVTVGYGIDALAREDLLRRFVAALESMPMGVRRRRVLTLTLQGVGAEDIAKEVSASVRTIYNDLAAIKKLIEALHPTDDPPPHNGGGGKSGLPRGDPVVWASKWRARRVASLLTLELTHKELEDENLRKGRRPNMVARRRQHEQSHGRAEAAADELVALHELRRALLQLPAFRDAGLAPPWNDDEDGTPPRNLEDVLRHLLHRPGGGRR